jgi:hypothetical protein
MRLTLPAICLSLLSVGVAVAQDSLNVRLVGSLGTAPSRALDVAVIGDYAYLTDDSLFRVIYLGDPEQPPIQVGCVEGPGIRLAVQGDYVYVASDSERLRVISVADPTNPVEVGRCDIHRAPKDIALSGNYAFVAAVDSGLRIISIADPTNPVEVAHIDTFGITLSVAVSGEYAYVGAEKLMTVLISDPTHPVTVGSCPTYGPATCVTVSGWYAYVVDWESLLVVRVADPTHPVQVWQQRGDFGGVAVSGSYLYVGAKGVKVFSLADPGHPFETGHYTIAGTSGAAGVAADGDYAYVACSWEGLLIFQYYGPGVEESHKPQAVSHKPATTHVRSLPARAAAFDAMGRRVVSPKAGVYFLRSEPSAVSGQPSSVTKVIVTK